MNRKNRGCLKKTRGGLPTGFFWSDFSIRAKSIGEKVATAKPKKIPSGRLE